MVLGLLANVTPSVESLGWSFTLQLIFFVRTAVLRKLFDIRFSYRHCNFSSVCPLVKMALKTKVGQASSPHINRPWMSDSASSKRMYTCINMHGICVHKNPNMGWLKLVNNVFIIKHKPSKTEFDVGIRILRSSVRGVFHSILLLYFNSRINKDYWLIDWLIDWLITLTVNQTRGRRFSHFKRKYTYSRSPLREPLISTQ